MGFLRTATRQTPASAFDLQVHQPPRPGGACDNKHQKSECNVYFRSRTNYVCLDKVRLLTTKDTTMLNSAHSIIATRLQMWGAFFATGHDASPVGATDNEFGLCNLIEMARDTDSLKLHRLADLIEHAGRRYTAAMNRRMFEVLMQDDQPAPAISFGDGYTPAVSLPELEAALAS